MEKRDFIRRLKLIDEAGEYGCSTNRQTLKGCGEHWHDFYEIEIIADGECTYWYNGAKQTRRKGDITLLTPADFHKMTATQPFTLINIEFGVQWVSENMRAVMCAPDFTKLQHLEEAELDQLLSAVDLLEKEYTTDGPCVGQLLEYIFSRFIHCKKYNADNEDSKDYTSSILRAISYIEQHFREKITLETLSQVSGYHPTYFSKMFRKLTGENYIDRLTTLRINYAKMLLRRGVPVSEACFASGFGSVSNFSAMFKKSCGESPNQYRSRHENELKNSEK